LRAAAIAAAVGAVAGIIIFPIFYGWNGVGFMALLGAFAGWWLWLFWRALRGDQTIRWLAIPGLAAMGALIFIVERPNLERAERFRADGVRTRAVVTATLPHQHNQIAYRYAVGSADYDGKSAAPGNAKDFKPGDTVTIVYLRSNPAVSDTGRRTETWSSVLAESCFGALWLVSGAVNLHVYVKRPMTAFWRRSRRA
jgi:hypothetical protein